MKTPTFKLEEKLRTTAKNPKLLIAGLDEAGTGSWAGPIVAAAVFILGRPEWLYSLRDSKQLTRRQRDRLYKLIIPDSNMSSIFTVVSNTFIDKKGLKKARHKAILDIIEVYAYYDNVGFIIDDHNLLSIKQNFPNLPLMFIDKADVESYSVAAASIVAKTLRDRYMEKMAELFPNYGFEKHKGYGTPQHLEALKKYGPCPIHRYSYKPIQDLIHSPKNK